MTLFGFNTCSQKNSKLKPICSQVLTLLLVIPTLYTGKTSADIPNSRENGVKIEIVPIEPQGTPINIEGVMRQVLLTEQHAQTLLDRATALIQRDQIEQAVTILGHLVQARGISGALRSRARQLFLRYAEPSEISDDYKRLQINGDYNVVLAQPDIEPENGSSQLFNGNQFLTLSASYELTNQIDLYAELDIEIRSIASVPFSLDTEFDANYGDLSATYYYDSDTAATSFTLGRQGLTESRGWWWDTSIDSLQIYQSNKYWINNFGLSSAWLPEEVDGDTSKDQDDVYYAFGQFSRSLSDNQFLDIFFLLQRDNSSTLPQDQTILETDYDEKDNDLNWFGLRLHGFLNTRTPPLHYWMDFARVSGTVIEASSQFNEIDNTYTIDSLIQNRIKGWAIDLGVYMESSLPLSPRLGLSMARTSKDKNPEDNRDSTFRQTGWQTNISQLADYNETDNFPGWSLYGAALNPALSNLQVVSARIAFPLKTTGFLQFSYHHYRQIVASDFMADTSLDLEPNGTSRHIGQGADITLPIAEGKRWESSLGYSVFQAGQAFADQKGDSYQLLELNFEYAF